MQRVSRVAIDTCSLCGKRIPSREIHSCSRVEWLDDAAAFGLYRVPLEKAIKRLKYARDIALGDTLSKLLFDVCSEKGIQPDLVVPVPLALKRPKTRGYNQAALLARPLAWMLGRPYVPLAVRRIRETASQVGLSIQERKENMNGAFQAQRRLAAGKQILIVDDVLTTGATLDAVAMSLKMAGAAKVVGLVVARA